MKPANQPDFVAKIISLALLGSLFLVGFVVLRPFLPALLWALTLSIALAPMHQRLERALWHRRGLATIMIALLLLLFLFMPMIGLSRALIAFVPDMVSWLDTISPPGDATSAITAPQSGGSTGLGHNIQVLWHSLQADIALLQYYVGTDLKPFAFWLLGEGRILGNFVLEFALGIVLATTLLHQQVAVSDLIFKLFTRVGGELALRMASHSATTVRATVVGVLLASAAQSAVASVAYIASGVPHWVILSGLTFLLAMFQIGPVLIWAPIAVWLGLQDQIGLMVFVILWGVFAVGLTDNLVRTVFVARTSEMPGLLAFMGAVGGLFAWGIVGVFLGPVILAVCLKLVTEWIESTPVQAPDQPD